MELFFKALAVILGGIAAYFLWQGNKDGAFLGAVFAAVAFFLSVRFQVKARIARREAENAGLEDEYDEEFEDSEAPALLSDAPAGAPLTEDRRPKSENRL
jgi:hypothetical protein